MTVEAILLGTAQDRGLPQAGCYCLNCQAARADSSRRAWVACLGLADHAAGQAWLLDATPDFREQLHALHDLAPDCVLAGLALTHAHVGHYAGLIHLGREAWHTHGLPVYVSGRMADFLRTQAPWSQLVALGNSRLPAIAPGRAVPLSPGRPLTPYRVPHRDEFSDTLAFVAGIVRASSGQCCSFWWWRRPRPPWPGRPISDFGFRSSELQSHFFSP